MELLTKVSSLVLTETCAKEYFTNFNFFDGDCFKATLSKCLGIALILGSVLVKLPQIIKIYNNRSGAGISIISVSFELCSLMLYTSYNYMNAFPFSSWGDTAFLLLQTMIIGFLVLHYAGRTIIGLIYCSVYSTILFLLVSGQTSLQTLWILQGCNIPVLLVGKLSQAVTNYENGHTGQLSAVTVFLMLGGSLARIFTSIQETGDLMSIATYLFSAAANGVIAAQMVHYWKVDIPSVESKKKN